MRKADVFLSLLAACALLGSACSDEANPNDSGAILPPPGSGDAGQNTQTMSPSTTGDAGASAPTGMDSGIKPTNPTVDTGVPTMVPVTPAGDGGAPDALVLGDGAVDGAFASSDPEFDTCYAAVKPACVAKEMNTAALMETPCKALTNIPLPLVDGGVYGPTTVTAGPYGGKTEWNQGKGTTFVNEVNLGEEICVPIGIDTFMEPQSVVAEIKNLRDVDWSLYTVFRPACMKKGEKYPVITWANGTCGEIAGYSALLTTVASYGYIIVASNSTFTAIPPTDTVQLRALDYAKSINEDPKSIFYQRLDMDHIGAMGHSQGAGATGNSDNDPRIKALIFWNSGNSNNKPFLNVSGERDVSPTTVASMTSDANAATQPGAWIYYHKIPETGGSSTGHLTLMEQPERVIDLAIAWWDWQLKGSDKAKQMFVGDTCGLCNKKDEFDYGHNTLLK